MGRPGHRWVKGSRSEAEGSRRPGEAERRWAMGPGGGQGEPNAAGRWGLPGGGRRWATRHWSEAAHSGARRQFREARNWRLGEEAEVPHERRRKNVELSL